jgi:hypothetical protein
MRSLLFGLLSIFTVNQVFASGDTPASLERDIERSKSSIAAERARIDQYEVKQARLQRENYNKWALDVGLPPRDASYSASLPAAPIYTPPPSQRSAPAAAAPSASPGASSAEIKDLYTKLEASSVKLEQISKNLDSTIEELHKKRETDSANAPAVSEKIAEIIASPSTDPAKKKSALMFEFKKANEALETIDLLADANELKQDVLKEQSDVDQMMDSLDQTVMGNYLLERQKKLLSSGEFCAAAKKCGNGSGAQEGAKANAPVAQPTLVDEGQQPSGGHSSTLKPGDGVRLQNGNQAAGLPKYPMPKPPVGIASPEALDE